MENVTSIILYGFFLFTILGVARIFYLFKKDLDPDVLFDKAFRFLVYFGIFGYIVMILGIILNLQK